MSEVSLRELVNEQLAASIAHAVNIILEDLSDIKQEISDLKDEVIKSRRIAQFGVGE
jgi:hypothetical protein